MLIFMRALYRYAAFVNTQAAGSVDSLFESRGDLSRAREYEQIYDVAIGLLEQCI